MTGLYVHIPFCKKKCLYCDFYSLPNSENLIGDYIDAVLTEAEKHEHLRFDTVFFGGGTPSLLGSANFSRLYEGLKSIFSLNPIETTVEVNPESADKKFLLSLKNAGINRISIGVQSLNDEELKACGRIHDRRTALECLENALETCFKSVSADVIIGLPGQSWVSLSETLKILINLGLNHISAYGLQLEDDTPMGMNPPPTIPDDDSQSELFYKTKSMLEEAGFVHYEISNFAKSGHECLHNKIYWHCEDYLGLGPNASSHLEGVRFKNKPDLKKYIGNPTGQVLFEECLDQSLKLREEAMLRLRLLKEGIEYDERFQSLKQLFDNMVKDGGLEFDGKRYRIHPSKIYVSNPIFAKVLGL